MRYLLSKLIPMRFTSSYGEVMGTADAPTIVPRHDSWWQWRDRIFRHYRRVN